MPTLDFTNRKPEEELAKLPRPTNADLEKLFGVVDKVVIKDGGVFSGKALTGKVLLNIVDQDKIQRLQTLLELVEPTESFYCLCLGDYAIELISDDSIKVTIGFHHGVSIRYDQWNGDAPLARNEELLEFLAALGLTSPLEGWLESKRRNEVHQVAERDWFHNAPKCFHKYKEYMNGFGGDYLSALIEELNVEIPERETQVITLLQTYGRSENLWSGYPVYEEVPKYILQTFSIQEIISVYLNTDRNYKTRRGLGRFLCDFNVKKNRRKHIKHIPQEVINDLQKCFEHLDNKGGIHEVARLNRDKNKNKN
ncbi:MAG: hypothetical protein J7621_08730 [Niastella sp.]|nr:hypothetical protein [Niastella sp.]